MLRSLLLLQALLVLLLVVLLALLLGRFIDAWQLRTSLVSTFAESNRDLHLFVRLLLLLILLSLASRGFYSGLKRYQRTRSYYTINLDAP